MTMNNSQDIQRILNKYNCKLNEKPKSVKHLINMLPPELNELHEHLYNFKRGGDNCIYNTSRLDVLIDVKKILMGLNTSEEDKTDIMLESYKSIISKVPKQVKIIKANKITCLQNLKKLSCVAMREIKRALSKTSKTNPTLKSKKFTREIHGYHKKKGKSTIQKGPRAITPSAAKQRIEKMALKKELEEKEIARQNRKLHFLINQTELFAHFMAKKAIPKGDEDFELAKEKAFAAAEKQKKNLEIFDKGLQDDKRTGTKESKDSEQGIDKGVSAILNVNVSTETEAVADNVNVKKEVEQPKSLNATLKSYQLQGLRWIVNLFNQGINGILADDMGLGKTVQSIAFLAHLHEHEKIPGPFLIITPASTLHNWQSEFERFLPIFDVLLYAGTVNERKSLRKNLSQRNVIITSYQMVVTDEKYFKKVKWMYMILDEAQAIKCSTSIRWKTLLNLACRNRLLLTGTPIQNTMHELWALLHFIMPTLFDSHEEFNQWFSKDIEHNKKVDETQLQRLHMVLKPFMLRRIKDEVKDELGVKYEKDIICQMSLRQCKYYKIIKEQKSVKDERILLDKYDTDYDNVTINSNNNDRQINSTIITNAAVSTEQQTIDLQKNETLLNDKKLKKNESKTMQIGTNDEFLNVMMQFRKVCNHPDLFEREEVKSGYCLTINDQKPTIYIYPIKRSRLKFFMNSEVADLITEYNFKRKRLHYSIVKQTQISSYKKEQEKRNSEIEQENYKRRKLDQNNQQNINKDRNYLEETIQLNEKNITYNLILFDEFGRYSTYFNQKKAFYDCTDTNKKSTLQELSSKILKNQTYKSYSGIIAKKVIVPPIDVVTHSITWLKNQNSLMENLSSIQVTVNIPIDIPRLDTFISDSGKLVVLDFLLNKLKSENHRVLIYFQMTKMMNLFEDYLIKRGFSYSRLDGSCRLKVRRDLVKNWQETDDKFIFMLSTRAGGLGINLTAADTVIFYDSDWNPTVDQQAMDRAYRLGQTKDVTVYRLIMKDTVEERIMEKATRKDEIQKLVIRTGEFNNF